MNSMLRLNRQEQEELDKIALQLNKIRLDKKQKPLLDSKVLHELIGLAMDTAKIDDRGNLYLETESGNLYYRK